MKLIKSLTLKFGAKTGSAPLELKPTGITLFVGPNNSGKSLVLREIEKFCSTYNKQGDSIIESIEFNLPDEKEIIKDLETKKTLPNKGENVPDGAIVVQRINTYKGLQAREIIQTNQIKSWSENKQINALARYYFSLLTVRLDGATRTNLLNPNNRGDLLETPTNILAALFQDGESRKKLRKLTFEAFGKHFTIDALNQAQLRARLADRAPVDELEEQALDKRARDYHKASLEITEASDGVKAFTGMVATVLGQNCKIPLIDEPEAFLHPPLAKRLGKELAEISVQRDATAFIATHSADFLMGCVSGTPAVNIVRLTYKGGKPTARLLSHDRLNEIIKSPIMRSTGVLSALFHEGAIVCEGDSDRALYQEINDRLSSVNKTDSSEALFINAHSKQSTAKIAGPLREMGIPAAIVVDFDVFKGNEDFKHILSDLGVPQVLANGWCQTKALIAQHCSDNKIDWKKRGMLDIADEDIRISVKNLIQNLRSFGVFVVPNGELESWLKDLDVVETKNKRNWLLSAFDKLGGDPDAPDFVGPRKGDIWDFVRAISFWINDPEREGV
ncbi:ATP-binding protein [Alteromonas sp. Cnat2-8]|uniref:ATP-dependent nuclease n=1 Tax=Alteromonas sp. Cnat2-8 TaxID=2917728 RepID=UPI001EF5C6BF|nr:AAA family ATPase [Alteromonas sp. Cnat2-8]MCG7654358.1 ATP-binding protein [Alteromonas sp. Cnat2-8]